ncbi:hypothetical protein OG806_49405 [Streptomyces sp. NBC_00882]|uniref:hypothetical protein n=1 Tax=Streptomyces TaxID=1883 RepID=UPI0038639EAF|nr:hypothetical protein OG806_49405 [Streptomyces sp. NBC_00882]WSZ63824.1 hypothetical protein OH824_48680 [Streptomyces canus]
MKTISDFAPVLGLPVRQDEGHLIEEIASAWSVTLPADFVEIAGAYGDIVISDYIYFCGARTLREYADGMGRKLEASRAVPVPHTVLPTPGGALVWGNTIEGDQLFLVPRDGGSWTVSAFRRGWADWHDTELGFSDWLYLALPAFGRTRRTVR